MIELPMMIRKHVESPDRGEAVRRAMGTPKESGGFARALGEQNVFGSPDARLPQAGALVTPAALGAGSVFGRTLGEKAATDPALASMLSGSGSMAKDAAPPSAAPAASLPPTAQGSRSDEPAEKSANAGIPLKRATRISLGATALPLNGRGESGGIALSGLSAGIPLRGGIGGIALDARSLRTLSRVREKSSDEKRVFGEGGLSAQFESGGEGVGAVGYDRMGGTSYGLYQISSRQGTFKEFLKFLDQEDSALAERLRAAGSPDTGSRSGGVPEAWKSIAAEDAEHFAELQHDFIRKTHFEPVLRDVEKTLGVRKLSDAMKEVVWSTAVQHGPNGARRLFSQAAERVGNSGELDERALIRDIYALRKEQFGSSDGSVREAVRRRLDTERELALNLAGKDGKNRLA